MEFLIQYIKEHPWRSILAASVLFFIYVIAGHVIPLLQETGDIQSSLKANQKKIEQVSKWEVTYSGLQNQKKTLQQKIEKFVGDKQYEAELADVLSFLSRKARKRRISILSVQPLESLKAARRTEIPVVITVSGRYHALGYFINDVENASFMIKVEDIHLERQSMTSNIILAQISILVYSLG